jgi:hypothetical protein
VLVGRNGLLVGKSGRGVHVRSRVGAGDGRNGAAEIDPF